MRLTGEYEFDGPREDVWELLRDPKALAAALPGTKSLTQTGDNEYAGQMQVRVGPVAGVFSGRILVSDETPPESCTLSVEAKGSAGFARGTGDVKLVDQGDGTTLMTYDGELQVGGKLAGVGQRLVGSVSRSMVRQGLESLNKLLQVRVAGEVEGEEVDEWPDRALPETLAERFRPPSEAEFAAAILKDMAAQIFSPEYQTTWIAVIAAIMGVVAGFWLGRRCHPDRSTPAEAR